MRLRWNLRWIVGEVRLVIRLDIGSWKLDRRIPEKRYRIMKERIREFHSAKARKLTSAVA